MFSYPNHQQQQYKRVNNSINNINNQMSIANKSCSNINVYPQIIPSTSPLTPIKTITTRPYPLLPTYHIYNNTQIFLGMYIYLKIFSQIYIP